MLDLCVSRKNKINLSDYDHQTDIRNRMLMKAFTPQDVEVLEEILYGSIRIPLVKLKKNLDLTDDELVGILKKLEETKLLTLESDSIVVDKEMRKYYDFQIMKYDEDFKPNMNYIQGILKKLPIHILPIWYAVPRSSNNIFASLIERYFKTPYLYERYLLDLNLAEPKLAGIIAELFDAKSLSLNVESIQEKYELTREQFEELMLHLEFNFVCCTKYVQEGDNYVEMIIPFQEWADFLAFRQNNKPKRVALDSEVKKHSEKKFHFVQDMTYLLEEIVHQPLSLKPSATADDFLFDIETVKQLVVGSGAALTNDEELSSWQLYYSRIASRLVRLGLAIRHEEMLCPHHSAPHWLNMEIEDKALYLYRHPNNRTLCTGFAENLNTEKNVKDVEKSLERIENEDWYCLDDFLKGVTCAIGENSEVTLTKEGPNWNYKLPEYQDDELQFMRYVIMQRLYEVGMVNVGTFKGKDCFKLSTFGSETLC
ncbi:MAG: hypothetical protein S4CHLAM6_00850 [Chlamydiae bacterium]|nr:hypothetical protein [Chlamydiota bacterium]